MKKLLTMMTAVALGTCAWADGVTLLDETFESTWALTLDEANQTMTNAWWSYNAASYTADELSVTGGKLALNTGSKVLTGNFVSDGSPTNIAEGLYFKASVKFKDPSDTLPTLGESDKFALVVLDNVDSVEGTSEDRATNLWVIAHHEADGKRAYKLTYKDGTDNVNITADWLTEAKDIEIKAYDNVMADGTRAGFLVKIGDYVCTVDYSYAITDEGLIDYSDYTDGKAQYLGYDDAAIDAVTQKRYNESQLLLSMIGGSTTLTSVDFQGQGEIDNVELTEDGSDFGTDAYVLNIDASEGVNLLCDNPVVLTALNVSTNITFTLGADYYLVTPEDLTADNGVYTYAYTPKANEEILEITASKKAASITVGGVTTYYPSIAAAITAAATNGGEVKLESSDLVLDNGDTTYGISITEGNVIIDLNGKELMAAGNAEEGTYFSTITVYGGTLTIKDTLGGGAVRAPEAGDDVYAIDAQAGMTIIQAGEIGLISDLNDGTAEGNLTLTGGTYTDAGTADAFLYDASVADGYKPTYDTTTSTWTVAEVVKYTVTATYNDDQVRVTDLTTGEVEENTVLSFSVVAKEGYEIVGVEAGETTLTPDEMTGRYSWTVVANVTITITASAVAADEPTIDNVDGDTFIAVDDGGNTVVETTNTTISVGGVITGDLKVPASVETITVKGGTTFTGNIKVFSGAVDISGAFTINSANGTTTVVLDENGAVNGVNVKPEVSSDTVAAGMNDPLEVGTTEVGVSVKTIPGLIYQLIRGTDLSTYEPCGEAVTGTGAPVKLSDTAKPAGKAFYKIKVSR